MKFNDIQLKNLSELKKVYSLKGVKTFNGMEGKGFNATLYKNGKKLLDVIDDASGGEIMYRNNREYEILDNEVKKLMGTYNDLGMTMTFDTDMLVFALLDELELEKSYKRKCKKSTVFITKDLKDGEFREVKSPYNVNVKEYITNKYGANLVEIINERYL